MTKIHKTITLPDILQRCQPWSLTPNNERIWKLSDNKVIRKTFETEREELAGGWNKMHNERHNLYTSQTLSER